MKYLTQRLDKTIKSFTSFTHYSLIILVLLTMSCTDKTQEYSPEEFARSLAARKNVPEPIVAEAPKPDPIKISYDKGLDLMLVYTRFKMWDEEVSELRKDPTVFDNYGEAHGYYQATYWDTNTHTYYIITDCYDWYHGSPITNQSFEYTIDEQKQHETVFYPTMKEIFAETKAPLLYIGSISPLERVYLDPTNQEYYIKYLEPFDTSIYTVYEESENYEDSVKFTNTNSLPIFPFYKPDIFTNQEGSVITNDKIPITSYTNSDGDKFNGVSNPRALMSKEN